MYIQYFKSNVINNVHHMRTTSTKPSSLIYNYMNYIANRVEQMQVLNKGLMK